MSLSRRRTVRGAALIATAALSAGALTGLSTSTATAKAASPTGYAKVDAPAVSLFPNVPHTITAKVGSPRARTIKLEARSGSTWTTIATKTSRANGQVSFSVKLAKSTTVRINAPKQAFIGQQSVTQLKAELKKVKKTQKAAKKTVANSRGAKRATARKKLKKATSTRTSLEKKLKRKPYVAPWSVSKTVDLTVEKQRVTIGALPPLAQPGATPATPAAANGSIVNVRVVPARAGRRVTLQTYQGSRWTNAGTRTTDASGNVVFSSTPGLKQRAVVAAGQGGTAATSSIVNTKSYALDFEDTFSGTALDPKKWTHQNRSIGTGFRSCASTDGSSSKVTGGVFKMGVSIDPARKNKPCVYTDKKGVKHKLPYMRNTQVASEGKYTFKHGFAAARIKVQSAQGMHSSFWSHPEVELAKGAPAKGTEIDVMEYFGDDYFQPGVASFVHWRDKAGTVHKDGQIFAASKQPTLAGAKTLSQQFAVYSVEWTPTEYVFRLDGREFHRSARNISQAEQFLALSNLTSSYEMLDATDPTWKDTADVDWVRVWKR